MVSDYLANSGGMLAVTSGDAMTIDSVNVRSGPSMADGILGTPAAGIWLTLTGENVNGWLSVNYDGYTGYVYGAFLTQDGETAMDGSSAATASAAPAPTGATGTRYTSDSVNLRSGPGLDQGVISVLGAGVEVSLTGNTSGGFAEVAGGSGNGWISVDYLATEPPAAPQASSAGQGIVDFAMQFQGYPYIWAGNTPAGFDCSGFTQYVVMNTLGIDITHSTDLQAGYGAAVEWGAWQPGDLIFFVGTYEGGNITHTGVYIGDGLMIHAENPGTGVVISDITSGYYADHYYSATRLV
jgi:cell wall-associated NlpC family hydrolase